MPKEGQVWPLQLVCLLLLVLGLLAFIDPAIFGRKTPVSRELSLLLLGGAVLAGIVLYSPLLTEILKAGGAGGAITQRIGNLENPAQDSVVGRLQTIQTRVNAIGDSNAAQAPANSVLGRLQALQAQTAALAGVPQAIGEANAAQHPENSMIGRLIALQTQMTALAAVGAAIGVLDDPAAKTVQKRLGDLEIQLGAIGTALGPWIRELNEKLDRVAAKRPQVSGSPKG